jgi:hypothetical protein
VVDQRLANGFQLKPLLAMMSADECGGQGGIPWRLVTSIAVATGSSIVSEAPREHVHTLLVA